MQGGEVLVNMVSLFPAENGVEGSVSPFRTDLLDLMKGLQPRYALYSSMRPLLQCSLVRPRMQEAYMC